MQRRAFLGIAVSGRWSFRTVHGHSSWRCRSWASSVSVRPRARRDRMAAFRNGLSQAGYVEAAMCRSNTICSGETTDARRPCSKTLSGAGSRSSPFRAARPSRSRPKRRRRLCRLSLRRVKPGVARTCGEPFSPRRQCDRDQFSRHRDRRGHSRHPGKQVRVRHQHENGERPRR